MTRPRAEVFHAEALHKSYHSDGREVVAVGGVSLTLEAGEVLALLGSNGAGKTTCIKMMSGLIRPDAGTVRVLGGDPHQDARALTQVGVVLEGTRNLYWRLTAQENLEYFGVLRGLSGRQARRRATVLLERFRLSDRARTQAQELSRGMQQKLSIAVGLVHEPRLLLLDEPTLGLDVEAAEEVKALVRELASEGCAVLLTTHQLDVAQELAHRVCILHGGRVVAEGETQALLARFSAQRYVIQLEEPPSHARLQSLQSLGASAQGGEVTWPGPAEGLYGVLQALAPLTLLRVERDRADLTEVFLKVTRPEALPPERE
ncbi:ABC transporter ATP-binding protein [Corallococcus sp. BB11-1]|uniref:ABC transporter ATP-binding protein n=1 Tax=Corallococcus sp. BB11-1 TaxID=2996783 RepID=UPI002271C28A|nr:ABC transporter ATP-binding protein [Corallococcus sp. BB11-1]MCY1034364.1 ABC transporter ATP-binding protein [Corallococcus sp. BB11-1]